MMSWISVLALAAAFQAPDAAPAAKPATPLAAAEADWARRPTEADLARFYPERATQAKVGGDVTLACNVAKAGGLSDCVVFRENPARYGFGEAALKIADAYGLRPERAVVWTASNRKVLVPVRFRMEGGDNPLPPGFVPRDGRTPMPERLRT